MTLADGQVARAEDVIAAIMAAQTTAVDSSTVQVATISALRALTSTSAYTFVAVAGYSVVADGGGGLFAVNTTDVGSADNGGTIFSNDTPRAWPAASVAIRFSMLWAPRSFVSLIRKTDLFSNMIAPSDKRKSARLV